MACRLLMDATAFAVGARVGPIKMMRLLPLMFDAWRTKRPPAVHHPAGLNQRFAMSGGSDLILKRLHERGMRRVREALQRNLAANGGGLLF